MLVKLGKRAWLHCDDCRHSIMIERTEFRRRLPRSRCECPPAPPPGLGLRLREMRWARANCVLSSHCNGRQQKAARRTLRRKVRASGWETHHEEHEEANAACEQDDNGAVAAPMIPATDVIWHVSRPQIAVDQYGCRRPRQQHDQDYPARDVGTGRLQARLLCLAQSPPELRRSNREGDLRAFARRAGHEIVAVLKETASGAKKQGDGTRPGPQG